MQNCLVAEIKGIDSIAWNATHVHVSQQPHRRWSSFVKDDSNVSIDLFGTTLVVAHLD